MRRLRWTATIGLMAVSLAGCPLDSDEDVGGDNGGDGNGNGADASMGGGGPGDGRPDAAPGEPRPDVGDPGPGAERCRVDADCRGDLVCRDNRCVEPAPAACREDTDCPDGAVCRDGQCARPEPGECICPAVYDPVCGANGRTYPNDCAADCAEVEWRPGACPAPNACRQDADCPEGAVCRDGVCGRPDPGCDCPDIDAPVCGADGNTYGNSCRARCASVQWRDGACPEPGECRADADCPEGARCREGQCVRPEPCACPAVYDPVCGADGRTYGNACEARCAGVEFREGECPDPVECRTDDQCPQPGAPNCDAVCREGACGVVCDPECRQDADCPDGAVCRENQCVRPDPCVCDQPGAPVCGADGETYGSACEARCAGVEWREGECADPVECRTADQCPAPGAPNCDAVCREGACGVVCNPECRQDADCPEGAVCRENQCVRPEPCACPDVYDPVCGADGRTYGNACEARCVGVEWREGACPDVCICPDVWAPVCGADGQTYGNSCEARCAGVPWREGACDAPIECRQDADCVRDDGLECVGVCVENACVFRCAPLCGDVQCDENERCVDGACEPIEPCACPRIYAPVCGADGLTYGNACLARCAGVEWRDGECAEPCVPAREACNGRDDDCDGVIDDDAPCREGQACVRGACRPDEPAPCEPEECGPRPLLPNWECPDGSVGGPTGRCLRDDAGQCGWEVVECPRPEMCGGLLGVQCARGQYCDYPAAALCGAADQQGRCVDRPEVCERILAPVCGCDGQTYSNGCIAAMQGVDVVHEGACRGAGECAPADCGAPPDVDREECADGSIGGPTGRCLPDEAGACGWEIRACPGEQRCGTRGAEPCADGQFCFFPEDAQCGATDLGGVCRPIPDGCLAVLDPVCGCDGRTYGNACEAAQNGVSPLHRGRCADTDPAECAPEDCGPAPLLPNVRCWDGTIGGPTGRCLATDRGCGWEIVECPPEPPICDREACGPAPGLPNEQCWDGSLGGPTGECAPNDAGECGWIIRECPPPPDTCGGLRGLTCARDAWCDYPEGTRCGAADFEGVCRPRPDGCFDVFEPVCGCDGQTYGNACEAHAGGTDVLHAGRCAQ